MVQGAMANNVVGSSSQACPFMVFSSPLLGITLPQPELPWIILFHITLMQLMSIGAIYISSVLSLTLLTHPIHSYLLSPHLIFHNSESVYSFYLCPPPMFIIRVCLCTGPALNHVVFSVWGLLLAFPSLDIDLSQLHLSSLQQPSFQEL